MKTIVLIDDEVFFRKSLCSYLKKAAGYEVTGEANNGEDGMELILKTRPDIALVDISMPVLDGLKMIQGLYKRTKTRFVLLTGYGEFHYARQAIQMGVHDYLLKPLNYDELMSSLERLGSEIDREREQSGSQVDSHQYQRLYRQETALNTFRRIINSTCSDEEFSAFLADSLLEKCDTFMVLLIKINEHNTVWDLPDEQVLCRLILRNVCCEFFMESDIPALFIDESILQQYIVLGFDHKDAVNYEKLENLCRRLMLIFKDTIQLPGSIFLGRAYEGLAGIRKSYQEANALRLNQGRDNLNIFRLYEIDGAGNAEKNEAAAEICSEMMALLRKRDNEAANQLIRGYFRNLQRQMMHTQRIHAAAVLFITVLNDYLEECGLSVNEFPQLQSALDGYVSCGSTEEIMEMIIETYNGVIEGLVKKRSVSLSRIVVDTCEYVEEHFMDMDLHLETIAAGLFISPQYLSTIFSREMHVTLSAYVNEVRMKKAKEMLRKDSPSIQHVAAMCGFGDAGYFSKCFKRFYGVSPKGFLEMKRGR